MSLEHYSNPIEAIEVRDRQRLATLVRHFGKDCTRFENLLYQLMEGLSPDYQGGYWAFYELSNGGFYMAPTDKPFYQIEVLGNGFDGLLSADAAGLVASVFALHYLIAETESDALINQLQQLLDFAAEHKEAGLIFTAID